MSDKTKVNEQGHGGVYTIWYSCLNCNSWDITKEYKYCPNCGKEIDWEVGIEVDEGE